MKRLIVFSLLIYFFTQKALFATVAMEDPEEINRVVRAILSNPTAVNWLTYEINNGYIWYDQHIVAGYDQYVELHMLLRKDNVRKRLHIGFSMKSKLISSISVTQERESLVYQRLNTNILSDYSKKFYCIQVKSYPPSEYHDGLKLYKKLRDRGYLVYYYTHYIQNNNWMRVRVGYFTSKNEARKFGEKFAARENMEYFVTEADRIFVDVIDNGHTLISTPSSRYIKSEEKIKEIYSIYDKINENGYLFGFYQPIVSPTHQVILFFDSKVIQYDIKNERTHILSTDRRFNNSSPKISPGGNYIAYLDNYGWGSPTGLRVIDLKMNRDTDLLDSDRFNNRQIKKFEWVSDKDKLLFISGSAYKSSGGELFYTDAKGNDQLIIRTEPKDALEVVDFIIGDENVKVFFVHETVQADKPIIKKYMRNLSLESLETQRTIALDDLQ